MKRKNIYWSLLSVVVLFAVFFTSCSRSIPSKIEQHTTKESLPFLKEAEWPIDDKAMGELRSSLENIYARTISKMSSSDSEIQVDYDLPEADDFDKQHFYIYQTVYKYNDSGKLMKTDSYIGLSETLSEDEGISDCLQNKVIYVEAKDTWKMKACIGSKVLYESDTIIEKDESGQPNVLGYDNQKKVNSKKFYDDKKWQAALSPESSFYYEVYNDAKWSYDGID